MPKLVLVVEVPLGDPSLADPHEIAEALVDTYEWNRRFSSSDDLQVEFVSAEWEGES